MDDFAELRARVDAHAIILASLVKHLLPSSSERAHVLEMAVSALSENRHPSAPEMLAELRSILS